MNKYGQKFRNENEMEIKTETEILKKDNKFVLDISQSLVCKLTKV